MRGLSILRCALCFVTTGTNFYYKTAMHGANTAPYYARSTTIIWNILLTPTVFAIAIRQSVSYYIWLPYWGIPTCRAPLSKHLPTHLDAVYNLHTK